MAYRSERMTLEENTGFEEARQFIRHAANVPLACNREGHRDDEAQELTNVSFGGLAFVSRERHAPGDVLELSFPSMEKQPSLRGEVVWSRVDGDANGEQYVEGIRFLDERDHFRARLVEQICYIEAYIAQQKDQGRNLTHEAAAEEWTRKYAAIFPQ
jgi:hypothetical protein